MEEREAAQERVIAAYAYSIDVALRNYREALEAADDEYELSKLAAGERFDEAMRKFEREVTA